MRTGRKVQNVARRPTNIPRTTTRKVAEDDTTSQDRSLLRHNPVPTDEKKAPLLGKPIAVTTIYNIPSRRIGNDQKPERLRYGIGHEHELNNYGRPRGPNTRGHYRQCNLKWSRKCEVPDYNKKIFTLRRNARYENMNKVQ